MALGTAIGYTTEVPLDGDYEITGYICEGGKVLPTGSLLPADSSLRANGDSLIREMRVGRLKLLATKREVKAPKAAVPEPEAPKKKNKR